MAKGKKKRATRQIPPFIQQLVARYSPYYREIGGGIMIMLAVLALISLLFPSGGFFTTWLGNTFLASFGWAAIPAVLLVGALGGMFALWHHYTNNAPLPLDIVIGIELVTIAVLAAIHILTTDSTVAFRAAQAGTGGGIVGWGMSVFFLNLIGYPLTMLLLLGLTLFGLSLAFRLQLEDFGLWGAQMSRWAQARKAQLERIMAARREAADPTPIPIARPGQPPPPPKSKKKGSTRLAAPPVPKAQPMPSMPLSKGPLPSFDLLRPPVKDPALNANTRYQAQIIEETLLGFGIPVKVAEINQGPSITQYGLELGTTDRKLPDGTIVQQRVRVSKIVALSNDLALALSAAPIRIEAPVPGRPLVGIEVPNTEKTMVSLRAIIEAGSFKAGKGGLQIAIGKDVSGQAVSAPLSEMPHLLIAGATGSGKSVCLNTLVTTLLLTHPPEQLRFLMIDPKMVELTSYNGIPHLIAPVVTNFEQVVGALMWVTREMERRYQQFARVKARKLSSYNAKVSQEERLPYLVVVIDELADLMMMAPDDIERQLCRLAQMARATGIHLVIATQRPSVDVVTGLIKANFPTRIAFAVTSQTDSRVILDTAGAERLLGKGDMLYMASDSPKLARLQGCFVSDEEIQGVVNFWRQRNRSHNDNAEPPWSDLLAEAERDNMFEEAIKIVTDEGRASTSMLQRRLGIGYPRASRLIDQLEAEGIIGPADGSKPREVYSSEDEPLLEEVGTQE